MDPDGNIYYVTAQGANTLVYDYISGWVLPAYRTIVCADDPDLEFLDEWSNFYTANTVETRWRSGPVDTYGEEDGDIWWDVTDTSLSLSFSSNDNTYSRISAYAGAGPGSYTEITLDYDNTMACDYQSPAWTNENYRIITTANSGEVAFNSGDWKYFYASNTGYLNRWHSVMDTIGVINERLPFAFISNNTMYASLYVNSVGDIFYGTANNNASGDTKVYDHSTHWVNDEYRIIYSLDLDDICASNADPDWVDFADNNIGS